MRRYLGNLKYTFVSLQRLKYRMIFVVVNFISNFSSKIKWCICCSTNSVWALCWKLVNRFLFAALSPHGFPQAWGVMLPKPIYKAHLDIEFHLFFQVPLGHGAIRSVCGLLRASADMVARDERGRSQAGMSPAPPSPALPANLCWGGGHCLHDGDGLAKLASPSMLWIRTYERKGRSNSFPCSPGV